MTFCGITAERKKHRRAMCIQYDADVQEGK